MQTRGRHSCSRKLVAIFASALVGFATELASGQDVTWRFTGESGDDANVVALLPDIDGDGHPEIGVGAPARSGPHLGSLRVFSGASKDLLYTLYGEQMGDSYGQCVLRIGDVNGDGRDDFVVGAPTHPNTDGGRGRVHLYSGADASHLLTIIPVYGNSLGVAAALADDIDGDGVQDILIQQNTSVSLYSSSTGIEIWNSYSDATWYGAPPISIDDVNGDGVRDWVVSSPYVYDSETDEEMVGAVRIGSGADGSELGWWEGLYDYSGFGASLCSADDLDDDGVDEIVVVENCAIQARSSVSGTTLWHSTSPSSQCNWLIVGRVGDIDRDGNDDVFVGTFDQITYEYYTVALSGRDGTLIGTFEPLGYRSSATGGHDFDADGWSEVLVGGSYDDFADPSSARGTAELLSIVPHPRVISIDVTQANYRGGDAVNVVGLNFTYSDFPVMQFGDALATNVVVIDDKRLTCTLPYLSTGPLDVIAGNSLGIGTLPRGLLATPGVIAEGDYRAGGNLKLTFSIAAGDSLLGIYGLAANASVLTPPYDQDLEVDPFGLLFVVQNWFSDVFYFSTSIPNDPAFSGVSVSFQGLIGPRLIGAPKDAAWTNAVTIDIQ